MAGYLIFAVVIIGIIVIGLGYAFLSDAVDIFIPQYRSGLLSGYNDELTNWGFDVLMTIFKFILIPALFVIAYFAWNMAQKPLQRY